MKKLLLIPLLLLLLGGYAIASDTYVLTIKNIKTYPLVAPGATIVLKDFRYLGDKLQLNIPDLKFGVGNGTSMLPVLGDGNVIIIKEISWTQVRVGDFVVYEPIAGLIVHQIVKIGEDSKGWYAEARGINAWDIDPFRMRKESVRYRVMAIFY